MFLNTIFRSIQQIRCERSFDANRWDKYPRRKYCRQRRYKTSFQSKKSHNIQKYRFKVFLCIIKNMNLISRRTKNG